MQREANPSESQVDDWDDLRFFLAVARGGGLSAAARSLGVNQSTVSRRVAQLEESLGARLFDRQPRGYALTAVGETMLAHANVIDDDILALGRAISGADTALRGTVRVTTVDEGLRAHRPPPRDLLPALPGHRPRRERRAAHLQPWGRREADVAIRPGGPPTEDDIVGRKLVDLPLGAYASRSYFRGGRKRPRKLADLAKHDLVALSADTRGGRHQRALAGDARIVFQTNGMVGQAIAARAGIGIALLPRFMGDHDRGLVRLFPIATEDVAHLWLLIHADLRQTARVRTFVDFLTEAIVAERSVWEGKARRRPPRGRRP